jgi:hypothetical protein
MMLIEQVRSLMETVEEERARQEVAELKRRIQEKGAAAVGKELEATELPPRGTAQASSLPGSASPLEAAEGDSSAAAKPKRSRRISVTLRRASLTPLMSEGVDVVADVADGSVKATDAAPAALHSLNTEAVESATAAPVKPRRSRRKSVRLRRSSLTPLADAAAAVEERGTTAADFQEEVRRGGHHSQVY